LAKIERMTATESQLETPPAGRLVIRVKLVPQEPTPPPATPRLSKSALLAILGVVAALLGWIGFSVFGSDPIPAPTASNVPLPNAASEPVKAVPAEPEVPQQPDPPLSTINEAVPDASQSALNTIRGTIRVSVRVTIDKQGNVIGTTAEERGPSRYFERLAVNAAKKWTFTPATLEEKRTMLLRFNFTRYGATAEASPAE
jgi:TonB family protein